MASPGCDAHRDLRPDFTATNPDGRFFSGVARITERDYEAVVAAGIGDHPLPGNDGYANPVAAAPSTPPQASRSATNLDLLFKTAEKLKKVGKLSSSLSEYDTRAEFIDRYLEALGYTELGTSSVERPSTQAPSRLRAGRERQASDRDRSEEALRSSARKRLAKSRPTARIWASAGARSPMAGSSSSTTRR